MNTTRLSRERSFAALESVLAWVMASLSRARLTTLICLSMLAACVSTQSLEAGESQVTDTLIGLERDAVMAQSGGLVAAAAQCATLKTGVGVNRRAYFLETCTWRQPSAYSMCGRQPESVEYAFLEDRLVAAMFSFASDDHSGLIECISAQALAAGYSADAGELTAGQVAKLSNSTEKTAITMTAGSTIGLFDSELAPRVHLLRDKL